MRVEFHLHAIDKRARLAFVGIHAEINRARMILGQERPLQTGQETGPAPPAQPTLATMCTTSAGLISASARRRPDSRRPPRRRPACGYPFCGYSLVGQVRWARGGQGSGVRGQGVVYIRRFTSNCLPTRRFSLSSLPCAMCRSPEWPGRVRRPRGTRRTPG